MWLGWSGGCGGVGEERSGVKELEADYVGLSSGGFCWWSRWKLMEEA